MDLTDRIAWLAQRVDDGTLTLDSFEKFIHQLHGNIKAELTAGRPMPFAKGRVFELVRTYEEMNLHPGDTFRIENTRWFNAGAEKVEFDLEHVNPTTGMFDAVEFKNARISQKDITQLQKYIDYMNSGQAVTDKFNSLRIVINSGVADPANPTSHLLQYLTLASDNGIPVDFV